MNEQVNICSKKTNPFSDSLRLALLKIRAMFFWQLKHRSVMGRQVRICGSSWRQMLQKLLSETIRFPESNKK